MNTIFICEDSLEGVFTAIYTAYEKKKNPRETILQVGEEENLQLFSYYENVAADGEKTRKVARTIMREFGIEAYTDICRCLATEDKDKAQAVYQTIALGLTMNNRKEIMGNLANDYVRKVFELSRRVNNEILHLEGFLRFQELEKGILFAKIGPKNNILTFLAPHFADRFPLENFVIYDEIRKLVIVHPAGKNWSLVTGEHIDEERIKQYSEREKEYQELFTYFCHKIAIKERRNEKLQRQMLPLRFQQYMVEF